MCGESDWAFAPRVAMEELPAKKWLAAVRAQMEDFDTIRLGGRAKQKRRPKEPSQ